jgi:uncharacterized protein (UPF0335 family)
MFVSRYWRERTTAQAVRDVYTQAKTQGFGEDHLTGVAQLFD